MNNALITAFLNFAGPVTFLAVLAWVYSLWALFSPEWKERKREWGINGCWALVGAAVVFGSTQIGFKVLSDETNLLSVSNMLTIFGKASNTISWTYYYHTFHAIDVSVPSRPILFPVLAALVQSVVGLRYWAPFVVNFFCLFGLLFLAEAWACRRLGAYGRALAWLALLMSPVLAITSTSGGFDVCSLFFGFASFLLLFRYAEHREENALRALVFTLVCFASVRYESIVALPVAAAAVWWIRRSVPWKLCGVALLLLAPLFVQRYLTWGSFENPPGVPAFSLGHFRDHFLPFLSAFFVYGRGPYPILLHWLGVAGMLLALRRPRAETLATAAFGFFLFVLLLSHHFGFADHPTQVRLFLPLTFALSLLALYFLRQFSAQLDLRAVVVLFLLLFVHHHQYALSDPLSTQLTMTREVRHLRDFLADEGNRGDLYVYDRPGQMMALGQGAVSWDYFAEKRVELLGNLRDKLYPRILFIERVKYKSPAEFALERDGYRLVPLREHQLSPEERLRISRVEWP